MKMSWLFIGVLFLAAVKLDAAVVGYWRFENNLLDSSGNNQDATGGADFGYSANVPGAVVDPGDLSNVASYDQGTGASTVAASSILNATFSSGSFTLEAYVYLNLGAADFQQIISSQNDATNTGIYFSVGTGMSGYTSGYNGSGVLGQLVSGSGLTTGAWHHVAWVGSYSAGNGGTAVQFYVDGTAVGGLQFYAANGSTHISMSPTDSWNIGGPSNNFNGLIDELRISNEALSPSEFLVAVPEPGTWTLFGLGALILASSAVARKTSRQSQERLS